MTGIELTIFISATTYFTKKIADYCTDEPQNISAHETRLQSIQHAGSELALWFENKLGTKTWSIISDVIVDNAWISLLVLGIILETAPKLPIDPITEALVLVSAGVTFCAIAWCVRSVLTLVTPHLAELFVNVICPKRFRSNDGLDGMEAVFEPPLDPLADTSGYVP